jgi:hypothetical protein
MKDIIKINYDTQILVETTAYIYIHPHQCLFMAEKFGF